MTFQRKTKHPYKAKLKEFTMEGSCEHIVREHLFKSLEINKKERIMNDS
jgi:hypothetical protein